MWPWRGTRSSPWAPSAPRGTLPRRSTAGNNVLLPGLVNAHTHIPMTLLRGYGGGCDLQTLAEPVDLPRRGQAGQPGCGRRGGAGPGRAHRRGRDHHRRHVHVHTAAIAQDRAGGGHQRQPLLRRGLLRRPRRLRPRHLQRLPRTSRILTEEWHGAGNGQILVDASIHGEYTSNVPLWQWMADYAARTRAWGCTCTSPRPSLEHEACQRRWGKTPVSRSWTSYGVWDARAIAAHCVWTTEEDMGRHGRERGLLRAQPGLQPEAGLRGGPGAPAAEAGRGQRRPWAPTGCPPTTTPDMFEEMKLAAVLHNGVTRDPLALAAPGRLGHGHPWTGPRPWAGRPDSIAPGYAGRPAS